MCLRDRSSQWFKHALFVGAVLVSAFLHVSPVRADDSQVVPVTSSSTGTASSGTTSSSGSSSSYVDLKHLGAGLSWAPVEIPAGATTETSVGYAGVRYWFNRSFGLDAGLGFGFFRDLPRNGFPHDASCGTDGRFCGNKPYYPVRQPGSHAGDRVRERFDLCFPDIGGYRYRACPGRHAQAGPVWSMGSILPESLRPRGPRPRPFCIVQVSPPFAVNWIIPCVPTAQPLFASRK